MRLIICLKNYSSFYVISYNLSNDFNNVFIHSYRHTRCVYIGKNNRIYILAHISRRKCVVESISYGRTIKLVRSRDASYIHNSHSSLHQVEHVVFLFTRSDFRIYQHDIRSCQLSVYSPLYRLCSLIIPMNFILFVFSACCRNSCLRD